ncbi:hypothetical protein [Asaia astilbis]|nr:hypothetical protein [Asaia astilbis]
MLKFGSLYRAYAAPSAQIRTVIIAPSQMGEMGPVVSIRFGPVAGVSVFL